MSILDRNIDKVRELCRRHKVIYLFAFGSILTEKFRSDSDIDFIVDFSDVKLFEYAENYFSFKYSLENLLKRNVDLLEDKAIKNPYLRESIDVSKKLIYG